MRESIMKKLSPDDLYSLEKYAVMRPDFRKKVMAHKKNRQLSIGDHVTLYFEDRLTMQYQVQEMLRAERIFELQGIQEELDAYNPLVPDGCNWKATLMIEYGDEKERRQKLAQLQGIEQSVWLQVKGFDKVYPIANEDLERTSDEKTSAVHFLRFELTSQMAEAVKLGTPLAAGVEHQQYTQKVDPIPTAICHALAADLD